MGTRGSVCWRNEKGEVVGVYNHWDSYPEGLGADVLFAAKHLAELNNGENAIQLLIDQLSLDYVINPVDFAPPDGKNLVVTMGVRASESRNRNMMIQKVGGHISGSRHDNEKHARPIYDWTEADVWLAIKEKGLDYNKAYDVMTRFGMDRKAQRIAPMTMTPHAIPILQVVSKAFPDWFDRLNTRLPGVRLAAMYGRQVLYPIRRDGESWRECYFRLNVDTAPDWIAARAVKYVEIMERRHSTHSLEPILDTVACPTCGGHVSWKKMAEQMFLGDPFLLETREVGVGYVEPEFFRNGAGTWEGKPTF